MLRRAILPVDPLDGLSRTVRHRLAGIQGGGSFTSLTFVHSGNCPLQRHRVCENGRGFVPSARGPGEADLHYRHLNGCKRPAMAVWTRV